MQRSERTERQRALEERDHDDGWRSRGYHPHFDRPGLVQSVTFRLHDSVPIDLVRRWRDELGLAKVTGDLAPGAAELRRRIARYEDVGHGACHLRDPRVASLVETALLHFDGGRYRLLEWCVMPTHVHVLLEVLPGHRLAGIVQSWKSFTAKEANRRLGRRGRFWMPDYHDRFVRHTRHLNAVREYIRQNPVKAGLCERAEDWPFGSASRAELPT